MGSFSIRSSHCVWEQEVSHTNHRPVLRENSIRLLESSKLYIQLELRTVTPIVITCRVKQTIDHSDLDMHSACHSWEQHRSSTSCCPTLIHSVNNVVYAVYAINNCQFFLPMHMHGTSTIILYGAPSTHWVSLISLLPVCGKEKLQHNEVNCIYNTGVMIGALSSGIIIYYT